MKTIYRIRRADGKWSRGGWNVVSNDPYTRKGGWTDKIHRAKVWKRKSDLNNHLTAVKQHCERYPAGIHPTGYTAPTDWEVVVFEVREEEQRSIPLTKLRFE